MPTFEPPFDLVVPRVEVTTRGPARSLMRHYKPLARGRNIWKLKTGVYTETQPMDDSGVALVYLGGHIYTVDTAEAEALIAAGYSVLAGDGGVVVTSPGPWTWDTVPGTWAAQTATWAAI